APQARRETRRPHSDVDALTSHVERKPGRGGRRRGGVLGRPLGRAGVPAGNAPADPRVVRIRRGRLAVVGGALWAAELLPDTGGVHAAGETRRRDRRPARTL